jgi:hypothetical protein
MSLKLDKDIAISTAKVEALVANIKEAITDRDILKLGQRINDMCAVDGHHEILPLARDYKRALQVSFFRKVIIS